MVDDLASTGLVATITWIYFSTVLSKQGLHGGRRAMPFAWRWPIER